MSRLKVETKGQEAYEHLFEGESLVVGRSSAADLQVADAYLSRQQARLFLHEGALMVEDLGSRNGTTVNGERIEQPKPLVAGDRIQFSSTTISILRDDASSIGPADDVLPEGTLLIPASDLQTEFLGGGKEATQDEVGLRRQAERLRILNEVHRAVAGTIELDQLLELILDHAFDHLQPEEGAIFLRGDDGEYTRVASRKRANLSDDYFYSRTLVREVSEKGLAALVLDAQADERFAAAESIMDSGVRSLIAAPLAYAEGSLGMIALNSRLHLRRFTEGDLQLLSSLAAVAALRVWTLNLAEDAAERKRLENELQIARRIQVALLPEELPTFPGYELRTFNIPSQGVSGDFYQVVSRSNDTECALFIADICGKGMGASLLAATLEALSAVPIVDGLAPDEIFNRLNSLLEERAPAERFATAVLAILDQASGTVTFASAGHNPCLLVRASGEVEHLDRTGLPLGLLPDASYTAGRCELTPGDTLVVYTDGITESANPADDEYGLERLTQVCIENRAAAPEALIAAIDADLVAFAEGEAFADDRTLVVLRRSLPAPA